jgi:hypothetical protein
MKKILTLTVPEPCHERWEAFNPTKLGGFCSSCQKEVIDFTTWDEDRIKSYFKTEIKSSCGRFYPSQLKTYVLEEAPTSNFFKWMFAPVLSLLIMIFSSQQGQAQAQKSSNSKIGKIFLPNHARELMGDTVSTKFIKGTVRSSEDQSPVQGVNVVIKGTANGTSTDADGNYSLSVPDSGALVFSFIGLEAKEFEIDNQNIIDVTLALDVQQLNEIIVTAGGLTVQRRTLGAYSTTTRSRWRLRNLFRRR